MSPSQQGIVEELKRLGPSSVGELAGVLELNRETIRQHLGALDTGGLVARVGTRSRGRGRPEVVYGLTEAAESLFPRREGELLRELSEHLASTGQEAVLVSFLEGQHRGRREEARALLSGLSGRARLDGLAEILTEGGYMAEVREAEGGHELRLCHCPVREMVRATHLPCRMEVGYVRELMADRRMERTSSIAKGDASCSYWFPVEDA